MSVCARGPVAAALGTGPAAAHLNRVPDYWCPLAGVLA